MSKIRPILLILLYLGLIGYVGNTTFSIAGETDLPHQAHLAFPRGPVMGGDASSCLNCHFGTPGQYEDVNPDTCNSCHSPGGAYDGVNDPNVGVLNNWENIGSSDPADAIQSMIYDGDALRAGKEKWCATCHDRGTGILVDDFEAYGDAAGLQVNWKRGYDSELPYLDLSGGPDGSQCMHVVLDFDRNAKGYGTVWRDYDPALDLGGMESISFYVKVVDTGTAEINKIMVRLFKPNDDVCIATFNTSDLPKNAWELVSIPRSDFDDQSWADEGVKRVLFRMIEKTPTATHLENNVYFDDIGFSGFSVQAPDVVGDSVTQGYYVTGHRFGCTSCHDPSTAHIDGETRSLYGYFTSYSNPTGFRFYSDSSMGLQLPYASYAGGSEGAFALCYTCHDESVITEDKAAEDLITNFTDYGNIFGTSLDNLHLLHVGGPGSSMTPLVYHGTCVLCHDPHGQANPAMTRTDMGDFLYFDANGCEISIGADSDGDGTEDWYDPDINMGGAQKETKTTSYPMCTNVCHTEAAPPNPDCAGSNPYTGSGDGWYIRTYEYVPHAGNMDVGPICLTAGCHAMGKLHATHFESDPPGFELNEGGCYNCHADGRLQCADAVLFNDSPPKSLAETAICASALCHNGGEP